MKYCTASGMFERGVANPERITEGTTKRNAPSSACCCVRENEEIMSPVPTDESR